MKKFILPVLSILFASFQANAEEWQIKEAGVIRYAPPEVFARHYPVTEQRALFWDKILSNITNTTSKLQRTMHFIWLWQQHCNEQ